MKSFEQIYEEIVKKSKKELEELRKKQMRKWLIFVVGFIVFLCF